MTSERLNQYIIADLARLASGEDSDVSYEFSLRALVEALKRHYGINPMVMIDGYDVPALEGDRHGYFSKIQDFLQGFCTAGMKGTPIAKAFLTGTFRIPLETDFSGFNNLQEYTLLDPFFSPYFGFTREEVQEMASAYHAEARLEEIRDLCGGWRFGETDIWSPWYTACWFSGREKGRAEGEKEEAEEKEEKEEKETEGQTGEMGEMGEMAWSLPFDRSLVRRYIDSPDFYGTEALLALLNGDSVSAFVEHFRLFEELGAEGRPDESRLVAEGLFTPGEFSSAGLGESCRVSLPNRTNAEFLRDIVLEGYLGGTSGMSGVIQGIKGAILQKDADALAEQMKDLLAGRASLLDPGDERSLNRPAIGLCAALSDAFRTSLVRKSWDDPWTLRMDPKASGIPRILIRISLCVGDCPQEKLLAAAKSALARIRTLGGEADDPETAPLQIIRFGAAFSGEQAQVVFRQSPKRRPRAVR